MSWLPAVATIGSALLNKNSRNSARDAITGTSGTPSQVVDTTPDEYAGLRGTLADTLRNYIGSGGLPTYTGATTAPMSGGETQMLGMLNNFANSSHPSLGAATSYVTDVLNGTAGVPGIISSSNSQRGSELVQQILSGATFNPQTDAILQSSIAAALRPFERQYEDELRAMRGNFTAAGQYIGPNSSSPFDYAKQRLQGDLATAMGDTSARIIGDNLQNERQRQAQILGLQAEVQNAADERRLRAAEIAPGIERTKLEGIISTLEANALPRLIEQFGITNGQQIFKEQQDSLMELLRMALTSSNNGGNVTIPGTPGTTGVVGGLVETGAQSLIDALFKGLGGGGNNAPVVESTPVYTSGG